MDNDTEQTPACGELVGDEGVFGIYSTYIGLPLGKKEELPSIVYGWL